MSENHPNYFADFFSLIDRAGFVPLAPASDVVFRQLHAAYADNGDMTTWMPLLLDQWGSPFCPGKYIGMFRFEEDADKALLFIGEKESAAPITFIRLQDFLKAGGTTAAELIGAFDSCRRVTMKEAAAMMTKAALPDFGPR